MEWGAAVLWLLVAAMAAPLSAVGIASPGFLLQAPAAIGGLVLAVLYIVLDGGPDNRWMLWVAIALGLLGALAVTVGANRVISGGSVSPIGQTGDELAAGLAGAVGPLFAVAAAVTLIPALEIGITVH
jgi:hypothetical protein